MDDKCLLSMSSLKWVEGISRKEHHNIKRWTQVDELTRGPRLLEIKILWKAGLAVV